MEKKNSELAPVPVYGAVLFVGICICGERGGCGGTYENGFCSADDTHCQPATLNGNGTTDDTADDYYEIGNAGQLYWFAAQVNGGNVGINAKLTADITVNPGTFEKKRQGHSVHPEKRRNPACLDTHQQRRALLRIFRYV